MGASGSARPRTLIASAAAGSFVAGELEIEPDLLAGSGAEAAVTVGLFTAEVENVEDWTMVFEALDTRYTPRPPPSRTDTLSAASAAPHHRNNTMRRGAVEAFAPKFATSLAKPPPRPKRKPARELWKRPRASETAHAFG